LDVTSNKYTGFLDVRDLVSFSVFVYEDQTSDIANNLEDILIRGARQYKIPTEGVTVTCNSRSSTISNFPDLSRRNAFHAVKSTDTLLSVCEILSKGGVHRVPVVNDKGEVTSILSQSSLIAFLYKNCSHFTDDFTKSVKKKVNVILIFSARRAKFR
jgi:CBS domain-containing protein